MPNRTSSRVLILANLLALIGVLMFDWDVLSILLLYWAESVVNGVMNVLRIICSQTDDLTRGMDKLTDMPEAEQMRRWFGKVTANATKVFLLPFFVFHYGAFCYAHLRIVLANFSGGSPSSYSVYSMLDLVQSAFWITVAVIFCSHLFSFFTNYIGKGEYKQAAMIQLVFWPYGRIFVMHLTIILGAILMTWLSSSLTMLLILISLKIFIDLRLHETERNKFSPAHMLQA